MKIPLSLGASLALLGATLPLLAQKAQTPQVVGWVPAGILTVCASLYTQDVEGGCQTPLRVGTSLCTPFGTGAGGTAYDARHQAAWVTNGRDIALHDLATGLLSCRFTAMLSTGSGWAASGLALADARKLLFQLETGPSAMTIRQYDNSKCPPVPLRNACGRKLPGTSERAMGLAYDEVRDLLYYTTSISGYAGWMTILHVALRAAPCTDLATVFVANCAPIPGRPVSGLAYDACSQKLYVTDGTGIRTLLMTDPASGKITDLTGSGKCCAFVGMGKWEGLAVVPGGAATTVGQSCVDQPCGPCSGMRLAAAGGHPALGNPDFALQLSAAPSASQAVFYLSLGACTGGIKLPPLCGPIHLNLNPPWPILVGAYQLTGTPGQCLGSQRVSSPVPPDPALCKVSVCSQWLVYCPTGGLWTGLSNALQLQIGGG